MSKGNLENLLGGKFTALPGLEAEVRPDVDPTPKIPGVDLQTRVFEKTFDAAVHETMRKHAPKYKELAGRFDPFDYNRMKTSVGTWSVLINRAVVNFQDAADHALALCRLWVQEDSELEVISQNREIVRTKKEAEEKTEHLVEGTKAYEIEQARIAWREAVRQRNEALAKWDAYVAEKRKVYRELKGN